MKKFSAILFVLLFSGAGVYAHTTSVHWRVEPNNDVVFFSATYHGGTQLSGGMTIDGNLYPFTGNVGVLPGDLSGSVNATGSYPGTRRFQTVTVSGLSAGSHTITLTCNSVIECPWPTLGAIGLNIDIIIVPTNMPPVAICQDITVYLDENGEATISASDIDNGSSDPDGDPITLSLDQTTFTCVDLGEVDVHLTVADDQGASTECHATVTVVDNINPEVAVTVDNGSLWPPNHKYDTIVLFTPSSDNCDGAITLSATVVSNEPDNAKKGDGNTTGDIRVTSASGVTLSSNDDPEVTFNPEQDLLELRSERSGKGNGRIYTITVTATDLSGNSATATTTVSVGHDRSSKPVLASAELSFGASNHPNPFNPETVIRYTLPEASNVRLIVYNVMGQQVRGLINANQNARAYSVRWNGRDNQGQSVATEMYIYRLDAGANVAMNKMLLVK
jgi:hypothetical protein